MKRAALRGGVWRASGQIVVLTALCITALVALMGVAVDFGYLEHQKRHMQEAADAAAVAGARALATGSYSTAAKHDASLNGFTDGQGGTTITVNNPPASGAYAGNSQAVEVLISAGEPTFFLRTIKISSMNVSARSVAYAESSPGCIYVLDPSASKALQLSSGVVVTSQCGVIVDSSDPSALYASGTASLQASSIGVVGGSSASGGAVFSPTPKTGIVPVGDPLAGVPAPTYGTSCDQSKYSLGGGKTANLSPGVYCGGITINGGATATLSAGTYVLAGGGLVVSGGGIVNGTGVTFYNTNDVGKTTGYQPISFTGGGVANLSAPSTGTLAGILFFQDRSITSTQPNNLSGGSSGKFQGALYFPTTPLQYSGGTGINPYTLIVADTLSFTGGVNINDDYSSLANGSPMKTAMLGE